MSYVKQGFDASAAFHTYAVDWTSSSLTWYIDGAKVRTDTGTMPSEAMQWGFIVRPKSGAFQGAAAININLFNYSSA